ncbi:MAG: ThuA domain-containing protein, partial [Bacteroidota bacterium]
MKKGLILIATVALGYFAYQFFNTEQKDINVLVFSKTEGFRHESIADGKKALLKMSQAKGFSIDTTEDSSVFEEQTLAKYNVIVFLNT